MEFICRTTPEGSLNMGERNRGLFKKLLRENPGIVVKITTVLPESPKQRRFYRGAVLPLWAFLDGKDYKDGAVLNDLHEVSKLEFNAGTVEIAGVAHRIGRTTKGKQILTRHIEKVIEYLVDQYGIDPSEVLNPDGYKRFVDTIFATGQYEDYIDYMVAMGTLKKPH